LKRTLASSAAQAAEQLSEDERRMSCGAIPANVLVRLRATVIAGLAKLVDEVNQ